MDIEKVRGELIGCLQSPTRVRLGRLSAFEKTYRNKMLDIIDDKDTITQVLTNTRNAVVWDWVLGYLFRCDNLCDVNFLNIGKANPIVGWMLGVVKADENLLTQIYASEAKGEYDSDLVTRALKMFDFSGIGLKASGYKKSTALIAMKLENNDDNMSEESSDVFTSDEDDAFFPAEDPSSSSEEEEDEDVEDDDI